MLNHLFFSYSMKLTAREFMAKKIKKLMSIDLVETIEVIGLPDACIDRIDQLT